MSTKGLGWMVLALAVTLGVGWLFGASGRSAAEVAAGRAVERAGFLEARALVLEGRLSLFESNFGDARAQFEAARAVVEGLQTRLRETGLAERAGLLEVALAYLREAAEQAAALEPTAQSAAEAALRTLETVGGA
jgi:hypothetical protein